jgi:hypothetical protein
MDVANTDAKKFDESYSGCARAPAWSAARRAAVLSASRIVAPSRVDAAIAREPTRNRRRGVTNSRARHF